MPFDRLKNFIFPGAMVFTYKTAAFSDYQDLVCLITYVNPTDKQFQSARLMAASPKIATQTKPVILRNAPSWATTVHAVTPPQTTMANGTSTLPAHQLKGAIVTEIKGVKEPAKSDAKPNGKLSGMAQPTPRAAALVAASDGNAQPIGKMQVSSATEIMLNYVQGQLVKPTGKFHALQMSDGTALLFAVSTDGTLNVTREVVGQSRTGWAISDISSDAIGKSFGAGARVQTFSVNQSVMDEGTIGLAMAVRKDDNDALFLSLLNSSKSDAPWVMSPTWVPFAFDADNKPSKVHITEISFSETDQGNQYIMVDIRKDPSSGLKTTARYIVDPSTRTGSWIPHTLPFELQEGTYSSCVGRCADAMIDGTYTAGTVQGAPHLAYVPFFNLSGHAAPMPNRFAVPGGGASSAIAAARNNEKATPQYGTSDFYAISNSTLYRWNPEEQVDDSTLGKAILTHDFLSGTDSLTDLMANGVTTLFGKNGSNVVYYTSCPTDKLADSKSWTLPVPVVSGAERITSFINLRDGGNTIFVAGGNTLRRLVQATDTTSKIWQSSPIALAAPPKQKPLSFKSYTTTVKVTGADSMPAAGVEVKLTTPFRTSVYIDGLYYVLSSAAVTLKTSPTGQITIIQATESIVGAVITATIAGSSKTVNPMHESFTKLAVLANKGALRQAQFTVNTVAGGITGDRKTAPLVSASTSDSAVQGAAGAIAKLKQAYGTTNPPGTNTTNAALRTPMPMAFVAASVPKPDADDVIKMAAGDLFNRLRTGVQKVIDVIQDAASGIWHFIVNIAGKVYAAVLNSVEAVVGAFEWVFDQIKTKIEDLIRYLEVLFNWDDIRRTKNIMHNMIKYYLQDSVEGIKVLQSKFDNSIADAQAAVAKWSSVKD